MDYVKTYKSFVSGRYVSEGVRFTAGILLPAFLMAYFGKLDIGIVMSVGALCVTATDNPGPMRHRVNAMLICNVVMLFVALAVGYADASQLLLGVVITIFGFFFSMLTVYGARGASVGIAGLLVMILNLETKRHGMDIWTNALYLLTGGIWYMLFSLLLYKIRPYKLIQQILGEMVQGIAMYLELRGDLYRNEPDYEKINKLLLQQQLHVQTQQNLLSEVLFKTRAVVKESTHTGRVLLKMYLDAMNIFETVMTTYQDYRILHQQFDRTGIMDDFHMLIRSLAEELAEIGIAIKSGTRTSVSEINSGRIKEVRKHFEELRHNFMDNKNIDEFISLGRIMKNIEDLSEKINGLHASTGYDRKLKKMENSPDPDSYTASTDIRPSLFKDNLNLKSNVFRHSLRVTFALILGYYISLLLQFGHSYWILLTIVVILKPAYSLTKKRNTDRIIGTFAGIVTGILLLLLIHNNKALLIIMILLMTGSYIFMRTRYFISVLLMTAYLLLFFHLLDPANVRAVLSERIIDTLIGSGIAFTASLFLVPAWEHTTIRFYLVEMINANIEYFKITGHAFTTDQKPADHDLNLKRKNALVALANLSDAFTRMLSEPKRFQKGPEAIHRLVVLNHTLTSHISTLAYFLRTRINSYRSVRLLPVISVTVQHLENAVHQLEERTASKVSWDIDSLKKINEYATELLDKRREEIAGGHFETETKKLLIERKSVIDQFNYIYSISGDIEKSSIEVKL